MIRKIFAPLLAFTLIFSLAACGPEENTEEKTEVPDLTGAWKEVDSQFDDACQYAEISGDTIEIYWVSDDKSTEQLYWAGSYVAPKTAEEPYTWTSENDRDQTDKALFSSGSDTKEFTYKNGYITYEYSDNFTGVLTIKMEKTDRIPEIKATESETVEEEAVTEEPMEASEIVEVSESTEITETAEDESLPAVEEIPVAAEDPVEQESVPTEYTSALKKAESYNTLMHMSKQGLYDQLTSQYGEGFSAEAAQYAVDNINADWNDNALQKAESYNETMHMSKQGLYDQLTSQYGEKFTAEEAQYAVDNINADWNENALITAQSYQSNMNMSPSRIYDQLTSDYGEKFTAEQAQYAIDHLE